MSKATRFDKLARIITAPPLMAILALSTLYLYQPSLYGSLATLLWALFFLAVLPLLAYPLQPLLPGFKSKGREGQRTLAILMSVAGYLLGMFAAALGQVPPAVWVIYLTYLLSGIAILLFNKLFHIKASGHSCGVTGPVLFLLYVIGPPALIGFAFLALAIISSIRMRRHTMAQLLVGIAIPIASFYLSLKLVGI